VNFGVVSQTVNFEVEATVNFGVVSQTVNFEIEATVNFGVVSQTVNFEVEATVNFSVFPVAVRRRSVLEEQGYPHQEPSTIQPQANLGWY